MVLFSFITQLIFVAFVIISIKSYVFKMRSFSKIILFPFFLLLIKDEQNEHFKYEKTKTFHVCVCVCVFEIMKLETYEILLKEILFEFFYVVVLLRT